MSSSTAAAVVVPPPKNGHLKRSQALAAILLVLVLVALYRTPSLSFSGKAVFVDLAFSTADAAVGTTTTTTTTTMSSSTGQDEKTIKTNTGRSEEEGEISFEQTTPLNIMLFYADDWTMNVMGKLNPHVLTPNIDRMSDNGIMFTSNCVTTSMCWISRGTMLTGTYASRHLFLEPGDDTLFRTHPWNETVFPLLKSNGYYTGLVGKWHAPQPEPEMTMAFDYRNFYYGYHWETRDDKLRHVTDLNLEDSLHFLDNRPKDKLFALKTAFFATHAWDGHDPPFCPQEESKVKYYTNVTIPVPSTNSEEYWKKLPYFFNEGNEGRNRYRNRYDPPNFQNSIKDLFRMATEVDYAVGKIIDKLIEQGVYNQTMIIFTTDNGNMHGEHGLAEKWYPYEESIRVPLVIVDPRMPQAKRGTQNEEFTLSVDLAPTILGAAKISTPDFMQGRDISDLYLTQNRPVNWRQDFFYEYNRGDPITAKGHGGEFWIDASFALITKEWKYIYWPFHNYEQIFHRSVDPFDTTDLLNNSKIVPTSEIYSELHTRYEALKKWVQSGNHI